MHSFQEFIQNIKEEVKSKETKPDVNLQKEASEKKAVELDDLNLEIETVNKVSQSIEKIATEIDKVNSLDGLIKVAEEAGNTDIANLVKIADVLGDKIANKVIEAIGKNK